MNLNEQKIRLSGVANILKELQLNKSYDLTLTKAEIREIKDIPNDDGTFDRIFKLTISELSEVNVITENDIIKCKKKGSQSQMLRRVLMELWEQQYQGETDFDSFYKKEIGKTIEVYKEQIN